MARPSKYDPKFAKQLLEHFKPETKIDDDGKERPVMGEFPTLAGFAAKIGIHRDTLHQWANDEDKPEFSDAYKMAKEFQEDYLVKHALHGRLNATFAIFTAKNVLGWRDKQPGEAADVNVNINNASKLDDAQLDKAIEDKLAKLAKEGK